MKYIRTNDGIYEFEKIKLLNIGAIGEVIKQADTIEELCDEFVILYPNEKEHHHFVIIDANDFLQLKDDYVYGFNKKNFIKENLIYGAIWTDKGLIYVAKVNAKGVFELI